MSALAAYPDPVVFCATAEDSVRVADVNRAFHEYFEVDPTGERLAPWLDRAFETGETGVEEVVTALRGEGEFDCHLPCAAETPTGPSFATTRQFKLRVLRETGDTTASDAVVFTPVWEVTPSPMRTERVASILSHDLRNPLDVAEAHREAAAETGEDEHFERIGQAHDRMERIIQDVLTLARGESAISPTEPVDIGAVASQAWEMVDTRHATLAVEDGTPELTADRDRLERLFENLFRNSVDHGRDGHGHARGNQSLTVTVGPLDGGFYVADDGAGLPAVSDEQLFTVGYSSTDGGKGLGLAIVDRIASAHGLAVAVTESVTGGARFEFRPDTTAQDR
jgi:signal transduction histidine kinase